MRNITKSLIVFFALSLPGLSNTSAQVKKFTLQVEALENRELAVTLIQQLNASGVEAYYLKANLPGKGVFYRVRVGNFANSATAKASGEKLRQAQVIKNYFVALYEGATEKATAIAVDSPSIVSKPVIVKPLSSATTRPLRTSSHVAAPRIFPEIQAINQALHQPNNDPRWEFFVAGGGSFWSHQDTTLSLIELVKATPDPGLGQLPSYTRKFGVRQAFAPGGRIVGGLVKNFNQRAGVEFTYTYGTNNFKVTALQNLTDGFFVDPKLARGAGLSIGMRSHIGGINYRHSLVNNDKARLYLTGGFNVTIFTPNNNRLTELFLKPGGNDLKDFFKESPKLKTVAAPGVNFGVGGIIKLTDSVGLRLDIRDYLTFTRRVKGSAEIKGDFVTDDGTPIKLEANVNLFGKTIHNVVPTIGIVYTRR